MRNEAYVELAEVFYHELHGNKTPHNVIKCGVSYHPNKKAVVLSLDAVQTDIKDGKLVPTASGMYAFQCSPMFSPSTHVPLEEGWKRDNKKKVDAIREKFLSEIQDQTGEGWQLVKAFAVSHGMKLKEKEAKAA